MDRPTALSNPDGRRQNAQMVHAKGAHMVDIKGAHVVDAKVPIVDVWRVQTGDVRTPKQITILVNELVHRRRTQTESQCTTQMVHDMSNQPGIGTNHQRLANDNCLLNASACQYHHRTAHHAPSQRDQQPCLAMRS